MGAPNIQQQLYLKKALNENTDGMFDHPEVQNEETITEGLRNKIKAIYDSIGEGYHMDRAHKILQSNASSKITPAQKARLKKAKEELDKIKPKYPPGQDPVVNSRNNS